MSEDASIPMPRDISEEATVTSSQREYPLLTHYTVLIYPFLHNVKPVNRRQRIQRLEESWSPWWARLDGNIHKALDDTYFFLPYIREVIFPETALLKHLPPGDQYFNWAEQVQQWNTKGLSYFCSELQQETVLRITYKGKLLADILDIGIIPPSLGGSGQETVPTARVEWIDAVMFPSGVGFLMMKAVLHEASQTLSHLVDLNYYLRTVHPPFTNWILTELRLGRVAYTVKMRDLMDFLTQGMTNDGPIIPDITQFMERLRLSKPRRYSESEAGQVYGERCHFFSYACVDVQDAESDGNLAGGLSVQDRLLFEFASNIQIGHSQNDPMWIPSPEQVSELKERNRISVWNAWRGLALKESVVFLGTEDIGFNKSALPHNVEYDYLPLYLYSLYQKYQLFIFADELMRKGAYVAQHLQEVRKLMDRFMDFRNKYWFNEVTRKPLGGELYRKFQQGLESTLLYELVSSQVKDLKEYYEERQQQRIGLLLNLFTFVFLPLGAVIGIFGMTFFTGTWPLFVTTFLIAGMISLGLWRWWTEEGGPRGE
jgi:hypothetical protein